MESQYCNVGSNNDTERCVDEQSVAIGVDVQTNGAIGGIVNGRDM